MPRRIHGLLGFALLVTLGGEAAAQQTPDKNPAQIPDPQTKNIPTVPLPDPSGGQTPPVAPKTVESKVPPPVNIPTAPPNADVVNRPLTAEEAVRIALRKQPNVEIARAGIAAQQGLTEQVRSALFPSLGLSAGYNNVTVISGAGSGGSGSSGTGGSSSSGFTGSAVVRQLIFDFNHTRELVRQSDAFTRAAEQNLTRVQSDLVSQVKQAYYLVVLDDALVVVNQDNLRNRGSQLALAKARLNSGLGLPSDVATAETAYSAGIITLSVAQNNAALARVNLALLMGIDARTPFTTVVGGEPAFPSDDVNALVDQALKQRPDVLQAQATVDANRHAVSAAKTFNAPVVAGTLGLTSRGDSFLPGDNGLTVGASVTFTPFDGGLTQGRVKEARANLDSAQASLQGTRQTVVSDVAQAWLNLRTAEQRVTTANEEVTNASEGVRIATGRYSSGLGLFQDIITAQALLVTARTDVVNAQAQVDTSRAALRRAIGTPPPVVR
ncbi:MAG: outer rane efflux protein [Chthonomonadaceae bacterium]|nr:outer rane efflux protein [Chthonomonadaceae bacterium]